LKQNPKHNYRLNNMNLYEEIKEGNLPTTDYGEEPAAGGDADGGGRCKGRGKTAVREESTQMEEPVFFLG
jgi:hypothetical protein